MTLSWNGNAPVCYEVRRMPHDLIEAEGVIEPKKKVRIVRKGSSKAETNASPSIGLTGSGIYRVRSWATRKPILDAELEFWLEIAT